MQTPMQRYGIAGWGLWPRWNFLIGSAYTSPAFALTSTADAAATFYPAYVSLTVSVAMGLLSMTVAFLLTIRYAALVRRQAGLPDVHWFR